MPHVSSSGGDDLENADQIKVYELEGDGEEKERVCAAKDLTEDKIDLTEPEVPQANNLTDRVLFSQSFGRRDGPGVNLIFMDI